MGIQSEHGAEKRGADSVQRLVRPFLRSNTSAWEERADIRDALEDVRNHSDELLILLQSGENRERNLPQAMNAFRDLETAVRRLWPNDPSSATRRTGRMDCNRAAHAGFAAAPG